MSADNGRKRLVAANRACKHGYITVCVVVGIIVSLVKVATKVSFEDNELGLLNASR